MKTITTKVYTIDEHPSPEKCFEWIKDNWHDLNNHSVDEIIRSLKALQKIVGGKLDYSISAVPSRGEFISLKDYDKKALNELDENELPLTGVFWDYEVIKGIKENHKERVLESLHKDTDFIYSDEGLYELCEANEYHFNENGKYYCE
jgi:hypothetical protein